MRRLAHLRHCMNADQEQGAADFARLCREVVDRVANNKRVRRNLPGDGRLRVDRQLPFLCIYRQPRGPDIGTRELVTSEAAYLFTREDSWKEVRPLCHALAATLQEHFGVFLLLELWADETGSVLPVGPLKPGFRIETSTETSLPAFVDALANGLQEIELGGQPADVEVAEVPAVHPPHASPLLESLAETERAGLFAVGIAVRPIYRDFENGNLYPVVLQSLRRQLSSVLRRACFAFLDQRKWHDNWHHESLGPSAFVRAARLVDQQLSEVASAFDFLLQVTPVNAEEAWDGFRRSRFSKLPPLYYRPLPFDPRILKRALFDVPIEHVEDVTLAHLFGEKQDELDLQLNALRQLGRPTFLELSLHLYGGVSIDLLREAQSILRTRDEPSTGNGDRLDAEQIAQLARAEIARYQERFPAFRATVEVRRDIAASLMVAHDRLMVADSARISRRRVVPLLHHEVGTHLLTYINGRQQPFQQLYAGLAGYESLQEGLAVLAEYLVGGLTTSRLRLLAGRVVAVDARLQGESFASAFDCLTREHGFGRKSAFRIVLRVYRGGGLTKDVIYLRGLRDLLAYLSRDHDIEPLYVGKIGLDHIPYVQELRRRTIIHSPALLPRFWELPDAKRRLAECSGRSLLQLVESGS